MSVHGSIEPGGVARAKTAKELFESATRASWLQRLAQEGLPVRAQGGGGQEEAPVVHSLEPTAGDPQLLSVSAPSESTAWWVDRRTMRINRAPEHSSLKEARVLAAADLADRAQLVLGRPVTLGCGLDPKGGRLFIHDVEPLNPCVSFTNATYRRTAPLLAAPSTLCPLSVDMLDQALRGEEQGEHERIVRRLYGRAYRRMSAQGRHPGGFPGRYRLVRGARRAGRLLQDLALPTAEFAQFRRRLAQALPGFDGERLEDLDTEDLVETLAGRLSLAFEALRLLERSRQATISLLPWLHMLTVPLTREQLAALAEPIPSTARRQVNDRLVALAHALLRDKGALVAPEPEDPEVLRGAWVRAKRTLAAQRVLGMDVRPGSFGDSDAELLRAVREARALLEWAPDERRRDAEREVLEGTPGLGARSLVHSALLLLRRLSRAKGDVVEGLAFSLLRVRAAVLEAGARLSREGMLDEADDAFYLELSELQQALQGEIGAYAARSRFRREDDLRWRHFEPPQRIGGRRAASAPIRHGGR